jgi:hypothetical protein
MNPWDWVISDNLSRRLFGEMVNALSSRVPQADPVKGSVDLGITVDGDDSSVDADDPIDHETATILQVLADNDVVGSPDWYVVLLFYLVRLIFYQARPSPGGRRDCWFSRQSGRYAGRFKGKGMRND